MWTLEKILKCDDIGFGCSFENTNAKFNKENVFITKKNDEGIHFICSLDVLEGDSSEDSYLDFRGVPWRSFKFFRKDGTEILPPEEKKVEKVRCYLDKTSGRIHLTTSNLFGKDVIEGTLDMNTMEFKEL